MARRRNGMGRERRKEALQASARRSLVWPARHRLAMRDESRAERGLRLRLRRDWQRRAKSPKVFQSLRNEAAHLFLVYHHRVTIPDPYSAPLHLHLRCEGACLPSPTFFSLVRAHLGAASEM